MTSLQDTICIVSGDIDTGESLRQIVQSVSDLNCAVVSSLASFKALAERQPVAAVLVDRAVCDDSVGDYADLFERCQVAIFGKADAAGEGTDFVTSHAHVQLRDSIEENDIRRLLNQLKRTGEIERSNGSFRPLHLYRGLVGDSETVSELKSVIERVAPTGANILLLGETGTGKEVVARNIHYRSANNSGPFVPVNCSAIPADLLESELFGHKKGTFTGAVSDRAGRFQLAAGGTLFLDEIGDMPMLLQVKLLRVLEERMIYPLGGETGIPVTARLVAATHRDLEEMVERGAFREDLYYRLNVVPVRVPPLRDRKDDIPSLCRELGNRLEREQQVSIEFDEDAMNCLKEYDWPGNVRELANLIERITVLYPDSLIGVERLPPEIRGISPPEHDIDESDAGPELSLAGDFDLREYLRSTEAQLIREALDSSGGVVTRAAELLRVRRTTLAEKVKRLGLSDVTN